MAKMPRSLALTSPHATGADVTALQKILNGANAFKTDFYTGDIDGEFGILSMQAVKRAEFWCGFPQTQIDGAIGQRLYDFLTGAKPLPKAFADRRAARLKAKAAAAKKKPLNAKALARALKDVGLKEKPANSNHAPGISDVYGFDHVPWCNEAVSVWYVAVGSKVFILNKCYSYVPTMLADARQGINGLSITKDPEPGDPVAYDWEGDGTADHTGLFKAWIDRKKGTFEAVEGNTAVGNDSNGGEVMIRERSTAQVAGFIHVHG